MNPGRRTKAISTLVLGLISLVVCISLNKRWFLHRSEGPNNSITNLEEEVAPLCEVIGSRPESGIKTPEPRLAGTSLEFPEYLRPLVVQPSLRPTYDLISRLNGDDRELLIKSYKQSTNLLDREAMIWTLGFIGGEEVVALFEYAVTEEFRGKRLTSGWPEAKDEETVMCSYVEALGFLARKSDRAYSFVKQGCDPWFWKKTIGWQSDTGPDTVGVLTSSSMHAVGESGRPDVRDFLEQLKTRDLINRTGDDKKSGRNLNGAVEQAAFYDDVIRAKGSEYFIKTLMSGRIYSEFKEWRRTENGKSWKAWSDLAERRR